MGDWDGRTTKVPCVIEAGEEEAACAWTGTGGVGAF